MRRDGLNLWDEESVIRYIAQKPIDNQTKNLYLHAYENFLEFNKIKRKFQRFPTIKKLPYVPLEKDIDQLIAAMERKYSVLLQLEKETVFRLSEALSLTPSSFDFDRQTVTLNDPMKGSNSRRIKISDKLVSMIKPLLRGLKPNEKIWKTNVENVRHALGIRKRQIAKKLGNPNISKINFKNLRHFKGTTEYHKTRDILHVQRTLGHKNIKNTLIYTHLINFESDEYTVRVASTLEECTKLLESGFEYITDYQDKKLFRKRKQFLLSLFIFLLPNLYEGAYSKVPHEVRLS